MPDKRRPFHLAVLTPVFNDWQAAAHLLRDLEKITQPDLRISVFAVNDGSSEPVPDVFRQAGARLEAFHLLHLVCNVGHQRAIAVGLVHLGKLPSAGRYDAVAVMDSDGEDPPGHLPAMIAEFERWQGQRVIFAARAKRRESLWFQSLYQLYRLTHYLLTGVVIRVGNFSLLPVWALPRLTALPDLWNHYAATVMRSCVPYTMLPLDRGIRYAGRSHMRLVTLITHGVSALSVYSDIVGTRLLLGSMALFVILLLGTAIVLTKYFITKEAIPGWTSSMMGIIIAVFSQNIAMVFVSLFSIVGRRSQNSFVPVRDTVHYLQTMETVHHAGFR